MKSLLVTFVALAVVAGLFGSWFTSWAQSPIPAPQASCDEQLRIVLQHDQDLQVGRQQHEIQIANLKVQLADANAKLSDLTVKLAKANSSGDKKPVTPPAEKPK